jgi:hypothetical protein
MKELQKRAKAMNREVSAVDFASGMPLSTFCFSASTPDSHIVEREYLDRLEALAELFLTSTKKRESLNRRTRLVFWEVGGLAIRSTQLLFHQMVREDEADTRRSCLLCNKKTIVCVCVMCGVRLCRDCEAPFHSTADFKINSREEEEKVATNETATSAVPLAVSFDAPSTSKKQKPA